MSLDIGQVEDLMNSIGNSVLSNLLKRLDNAAYKGVQGLSRYRNGIGSSKELLKQRLNQQVINLDDAVKTGNLKSLFKGNNIKISDVGGTGDPLLQELYEKLTRK